MPVVEKIESIEPRSKYYYHFGSQVEISGTHCFIRVGGKPLLTGWEYCEYRESISCETKIEAAYKMVYDFIIWLNQQPK